MQAIIKNIDTGTPTSFETFRPDDEVCFGLWLNFLIGPENEEGGHLFQVLVCTPKWIERNCLRSGAVWGRHMLIVLKFDHAHIRAEMDKYLTECLASDFWSLAQKVARVGAWEFEDYRP